jgi:methyl-accepting chemotaxis protein
LLPPATAAQRTTSTVEGLAAAAGRIGEVVALINALASKTNLLALNATIDAARAGEAGNGFAVVASEVKVLASQTAKATDKIRTQIDGVQTAMRAAVDASRSIGEHIDEINAVSAAIIASAVEQQGAATQQIAHNTQEAANRTREVSSNIGGVNTGIRQTDQAAAIVFSAADGLSVNPTTCGPRSIAFSAPSGQPKKKEAACRHARAISSHLELRGVSIR